MGIEVTDERLFNAERDKLRVEVAMLEALLKQQGNAIMTEVLTDTVVGELTAEVARLTAERDGLLRVVTDNHHALQRAEAAEAALASARAEGVAEGLRMAADGPRRASGPIDPAQGFATTGAEARWIADTEAGVYDNAPCPICGSELLLKDGHVYCRQCPAPRDGGKG